MNNILKKKLYNKFYEDYISGQEPAQGFLSSFTVDTIVRTAADLSHQSDIHGAAKKILSRQNADQTSARAREYIGYLAEPDSVILITGQQLGLFASPLYTIFKLITTLRLAEKLNTVDRQRRYIPVFWLETEDHDFREINHCGVFDRGFLEKRITYQGTDRGKVSVRNYQLEDSITDFFSELGSSLADTAFSAPLRDKLSGWYAAGADWTVAVRSLLKDLFESYGLLFFEPGDPEIKDLSAAFFSDLLQKKDEVSDSFVAATGRLKKYGYEAQVKYLTGQTFIHFEDKAKNRRHLYCNGEDYFFRGEKSKYTEADVRRWIREAPRTLSTTVISRPILQSWLYPVAAYIAGPGEIAYWAQLAGLFPVFNVRMPVVYPRISATLIEPRIKRHMEKYQIEPVDIPFKRKKFIEHYYKREQKKSGSDPIRMMQTDISAREAQLEDYLQALDPTLVDAGRKTIERIRQSLQTLESRALRAREQKNQVLSNHLQQIHTAFYPGELPQERYLTIVYYLNKFGPDFMATLVENLTPDQAGHQLVFLP